MSFHCTRTYPGDDEIRNEWRRVHGRDVQPADIARLARGEKPE